MGIDKPQLPQIAGYTTEAVLGEGGMATVYLAVQESLSRHVALKVMNQVLMADADFCRRFLNEGRLIAKLSHPNIVTVYDIGASDHFHYLSMTYLPGGTLREKIRRGLPVEYTLYILKCLADALGYAHGQRVVHRDIKPGNVMFTHGGAPVLTDFGIAKTVGNETKLTSTGMTVGSVGYMSPEQALGKEVDHRSDLYSLGVLFWQMLTGALPYSAPDPFALALKHATDPIPKLPAPLERFQPLIEGLMAKKPEDRVATAAELVRVIDGIAYEDIAGHSPSGPDKTVLLSRQPERTPSRRTAMTEAPAVREPAPKRRFGQIALWTGIAGFAAAAAYLGYTGLLEPASKVPAKTPSVPPTTEPIANAAPSPGVFGRGPESTPQTSGKRQEGIPAVQVGQSGDGPTSAPQGGERSRVESLLRQAESQWKAGRLTEPPGDNAFETYSRVLDLDPEQPQAKQELINIGRINAANKVFSAADALLRQGQIDDARRMVETGLRINPDDERLLGLQRALDYAQ